MTNTGNNINQASGQAPEALSRAEKLRESAVGSILESSRVRFTAILAALGLSASVAVAEEATSDRATLLASMDAPVAETVTDGSYRVAAMLPQEDSDAETATESVDINNNAWLNKLALTNPYVADFVEDRIGESYPHFREYLINFSELNAEEQEFVSVMVLGIGWGAFDETDIERYGDYMRNGRVPESLRTLILQQAVENGADPEWDIPAFEQVLDELREQWDTGTQTMMDLVEFAPSTSLIPDVRAYIEARDARIESEQMLAESEEVLRVSEERLASIRAAIGAGEDLMHSLNEVLEWSNS